MSYTSYIYSTFIFITISLYSVCYSLTELTSFNSTTKNKCLHLNTFQFFLLINAKSNNISPVTLAKFKTGKHILDFILIEYP